jgi:hypothetical protein
MTLSIVIENSPDFLSSIGLKLRSIGKMQSRHLTAAIVKGRRRGLRRERSLNTFDLLEMGGNFAVKS